jgi:hypothetical protein
MSKRMFAGSVLLLGLIVSLEPAAEAPAAKKFKVTSTLAGKKVLPHRIRWIARPSDPYSGVKFLIDGKVRWIEQRAPFSYSDDGGYLVTSWLSAGQHRFTVKATSSTGAKASETVAARVVAAPEPPAELAGSWRRGVPAAVPGQPGCGAGDAVPAGTWTLVFDRRWIDSIYPGKFDPVKSQQTLGGYIIANDWVPGPKTFEVAGSVTTKVFRVEDQRGGWWCEPGGPRATYTWSVEGDTLRLAPQGRVDKNTQRGGIFTGTWTRVH